MISTRHRLLLASTATLVALAGTAKAEVSPRQPSVEAHRKPVLKIDGLRFHDLDGDGKLTPYEDWRLSPEIRADDLVARMTLAEKAGTMMHGTLPGAGGALGRSDSGYDLDRAAALIGERHVTSMITRLALPPARMAAQDNAVQELAEATRLGVPMTISSDPRNHFQNVAGASENAAGTTQWPETLGLAALRDPALVERFATIVRSEYRAVGIHQALSPQLDIATEPRWSRITGTFGSNPALTSTLGAAYVRGFQGSPHGLAGGGVMTVVKHWVGYGASVDGLDGHNSYGRYAPMVDVQKRFSRARKPSSVQIAPDQRKQEKLPVGHRPLADNDSLIRLEATRPGRRSWNDPDAMHPVLPISEFRPQWPKGQRRVLSVAEPRQNSILCSRHRPRQPRGQVLSLSLCHRA